MNTIYILYTEVITIVTLIFKKQFYLKHNSKFKTKFSTLGYSQRSSGHQWAGGYILMTSSLRQSALILMNRHSYGSCLDSEQIILCLPVLIDVLANFVLFKAIVFRKYYCCFKRVFLHVITKNKNRQVFQKCNINQNNNENLVCTQ